MLDEQAHLPEDDARPGDGTFLQFAGRERHHGLVRQQDSQVHPLRLKPSCRMLDT